MNALDLIMLLLKELGDGKLDYSVVIPRAGDIEENFFPVSGFYRDDGAKVIAFASAPMKGGKVEVGEAEGELVAPPAPGSH